MSAASQPNFGPTLGAALIGGLFAAALFGVTSIQTFLYFTKFSKDSPLIRTMIAILWIMDASHFALTDHALWFYLVTNFANPAALEKIVWSVAAQIMVTNISNVIVQCLFARRVYHMSKGNRFLTIIIVILSFFSAVTGVVISIKCFQFPLFVDFEKVAWLMYTGDSAIVVTDSLIAATLCYFLWQSRTGIKTTDSVLTVLMMYSINTGMLTSSFAVLTLVVYSAMPRNLVYMGVYFVFAKLYFNSLLAALNAREGLRNDMHSKGVISIPMDTLQYPSVTFEEGTFHAVRGKNEGSDVLTRDSAMVQPSRLTEKHSQIF